MKILIIDNNIRPKSWGSKELAQYAARCVGATVYVRGAPQEDLPTDLSHFDKIVISGSMMAATDQLPWIQELDRLVKNYADLGRPMLGVCYGHQTIARSLGGLEYVSKNTSAEFGWTRIEQLQENVLLKGLPNQFYSFSSHYDEVCKLPRGFKKLARSEKCQVQAFQVEGKPIFGIQFHPEKSLESGTKTLADQSKEKRNDARINADQGPKLFNLEVGATIFRNFFAIK